MTQTKKYKLNDFHILYINLDRRPERLQNVENELKRLGLKGTRIPGIDGQEFTEEEKAFWMNRKNFNTLTRNPDRVYGKAACYLSHLRAIKYAIDNNLEPVLILEDDVKFLTDSKDIDIEIPIECDIFYLGGLYWWSSAHLRWKEKDKQNCKNINEPYIQIVPKYFRIACLFAYVIQTRQDLIDLHFNMVTKTKKAIDMMCVSHIQKNNRCFIMHPSLAIQSDSFISDVTDYGKKTPSQPFNNNYFF